MSISATTNVLQQTIVFGRLGADRLNVLALNGDLQTFHEGDKIIEPGVSLVCCVVVLSGQVLANPPNSSELTLSKGAMIGEMALITNQPINFSVIGASDGEVLYISRALFEQLIEDFPDIVLQLRDSMKTRLKSTLQALSVLEDRLRF
jgi:CRP-like cAMP-binding protein